MGYSVVKKAADLGLDILLRVPHLSHILQGEDTVKFKELKSHWHRQKTLMYNKINPPTFSTKIYL